MADHRSPARLADRYELGRKLGAGAFGTVYQARDTVLGEDVAIKFLRREMAEDPDVGRRFRQEIKLARRVRHPNVCGIHEYGEQGDVRYIVMEFIDGVDLRRRLDQQGALPPGEAFEAALQMGEGLGAIHEAGILHRDLKTANIMRDVRGRVRLMDFGIAKQLSGENTWEGTAAGLILGTPEYMSPELARGEGADFRSDYYALGVVIYEIFTGRVPFRGDTPMATILKHIQEPPPLSGPAAAGLPPALRPVLERALAKSPADRYASVGAMTAAVRAARDAGLPATPMATVVERVEVSPAAGDRSGEASRRVLPRAVPAALSIAALMVFCGRHALPPWPGLGPAKGSGTPPAIAPLLSSSRAGRASLSIDSDPSGAMVFVDEVKVGPCPRQLNGIGPGPHRIRAELPDHAPVDVWLTADPQNRQGRIQIELFPLPPPPVVVTVRSDPPGSTLTIDGAVAGRTPWAGALMPGPHRATVAHEGYQPRALPIVLKPGVPDDVEVTLIQNLRTQSLAMPAAPPVTDSSRVYELAEVDTPPHRLSGGIPVYRGLKRAAAVLSYVVDQQGRVVDVQVRSAQPAEEAFVAHLVGALKAWTYRPGVRREIPVMTRLEYTYSLDGRGAR